ncbi:hypothetical protein PM082_001276 [Marasmius tenuissimus]|nr:hypothetical protein PM082_001276 [Marasmius tenuissimus]
MGVHGLTTYLRESKRNLSTTRSLTGGNTSQEPLHFVVDGWSFIYEIHLKSGLPWVYGGEYAHFVRLVTAVAQAWINVGVRLSFVFDGPLPELKFGTQISRTTKSHIEPSLLFFRTSSISRATPRFLNESKIIPPLSYSATIHALEELRKSTEAVDIHFADEEGDPYAVELAGRLGAYVVGNDSDFVILNTEGYLGYIPLEEMVWTSLSVDDDSQSTANDDDGEFQQVWVPKWKKKQLQMKDPKMGRGIIPPENTSSNNLSLTFTAFSPLSLASHLDLPITLLPLLGALVGNDFSNQKKRVQELFFGRHMTLSERIKLVAETLRATLSGGALSKRKQKQQVESVMDLINKTVRTLLNRSPAILSSGEVDQIVDGIVVSTLQYAISKYDGENGAFWPSTLCALHEPDMCPMLPMFSRKLAAVDWQEEDMEDKEFLNGVEVRRVVLEAYRSGQISPNVVNSLNSGTWWPRLFLESPDVESVSRMTRSLRQWCCSIFEDAVGLPEFPEEEEVEDKPQEGNEKEDESDEDELIDVVEEDSEEDEDLLAPLRGALQQLNVKPGQARDQETVTSEDQTTSNESPSPTPRRVRITEYVRRGTRLAEEVIDIPPLNDLLEGCEAYDNTNPTPLLLRSHEERLAVLRCALDCSSSVIALPPERLLPALTLRWVVRSLYDKAQQSGSKEAHAACWTQREARCFLASFTNSDPKTTARQTSYPEITDRNVQLTAQILQTYEAIEHMIEVLLLTKTVPSCAHLLSGRLFHEYLTGSAPLEEDAVPEGYWRPTVDGMEHCFGEERQKKKKKAGRAQNAVPTPPQKAKAAKGGGGKGLFDLLGDMDA